MADREQFAGMLDITTEEIDVCVHSRPIFSIGVVNGGRCLTFRVRLCIHSLGQEHQVLGVGGGVMGVEQVCQSQFLLPGSQQATSNPGQSPSSNSGTSRSGTMSTLRGHCPTEPAMCPVSAGMTLTSSCTRLREREAVRGAPMKQEGSLP